LTRRGPQAFSCAEKKDSKTAQAADEVNMMNAISASNTYVQQAYQPASASSAKHSEASKTSPPEDTVHLSSAAKAAMGDVDHDGDSH
jgi:hypothetical protein